MLITSYCPQSPRPLLFVPSVQLHPSDRPSSLYRYSFVPQLKPRVRSAEPPRRHLQQSGPCYRVVPAQGARWGHQQQAFHRSAQWVDAAGAVEHDREATDQESLAAHQVRLASECAATDDRQLVLDLHSLRISTQCVYAAVHRPLFEDDRGQIHDRRSHPL